MEKGKLNFVIDALMFILLMAIAGMGFLMKYVLIPGQETPRVYGRHVELYLWGMNRHGWGDIHLYLAFTLLAVLVIHLILHWQMIVGLYGRRIASPQMRTGLAFALLILTVLLLYFPFLVTPEVQERGPGLGQGRGRGRVELRLEGQRPTLALVKDASSPLALDLSPAARAPAGSTPANDAKSGRAGLRARHQSDLVRGAHPTFFI